LLKSTIFQEEGGDCMQIGDDLARIITQSGIELTTEGLKMSKEATIEVFKLLIELLKEKEKLKPGKNNLSKLLNSGQELKMTKMNKKSVGMFADKAKKYGVSFAVIKEGNEYSVVYGVRDLDLVKNLFEKVKEELTKVSLRQKIKDKFKEIQIKTLKRIKSGIEKKLSDMQYSKDFRETDIANDDITPTSHNTKNSDNKEDILTKQGSERYEEKKDDLVKDNADFKKNSSKTKEKGSVLEKLKNIDLEKENKGVIKSVIPKKGKDFTH
jgi:hypothetical protein